jgi:hypothetical protein
MTPFFETRPTVRGDCRFHWLGTFATREKQQLRRNISSENHNEEQVRLRSLQPRQFECRDRRNPANPSKLGGCMFILLAMSIMTWMAAALFSLKEATENSQRPAFGCC